MGKKKIAFVVAVPATAEAFLATHFERLINFYDITLIGNFPENYDYTRFSKNRVKCIYAPILRPIKPVGDLKALLSLIKIFRKEKFDSVHSVTPKAGLLSSIAGWIAHIPIRIHIFTGQVWATRKGIMRMLLKFIDKLTVIFDNNILVDGESQRKFLIKEKVLKENNSCVLAHGSICGVNLSLFSFSKEIREKERNKFGFDENDVVFIFMGRLNHDKGVEELYKAFNQLAAIHTKAKLVIYGFDEDDYEAKASSYPHLQRNINFFYKGNTSVPYKSLQVADIFVLPTWREGFGCSVIEAQALRLPVITSDAYGVLDASEPNVTGLRCKVDDPEGLYECMKKYFYNKEMRVSHGINGQNRINKMFDSRLVSQAWVEFYKSILG